MQIQSRRFGGCVACHHALCARCRQRRTTCRSRASERVAGERETLVGCPYITVSQCCVSVRKRRMWRRQTAAVRNSQREGPCRDSVAPTVVLVLVLGFGLLWLPPEPAAAAAAVVMPANASRSPQARIERRNAFTSRSRLQVGGRAGGIRPGRAPLGAAYAIVVPRSNESCIKQHRADRNPDCAARGGSQPCERTARCRCGDSGEDQAVAERPAPERA